MIFLRCLFCCFVCVLGAHSQKNPFEIQFPQKQALTNKDYLSVQKRLKAINIPNVLKRWEGDLVHFPIEQFWGRCAGGVGLNLIQPGAHQLPVQECVKMGKGSTRCIVSYASYNRNYPNLLKSMVPALKQTGFDGYFLYRIGGFPNPTGEEIKYAGVPYCFKIFLMLEAQKLGFDSVLWVDAAMLPLADPAPLFDWIEEKGYLFCGWGFPPDDWRQEIYPATLHVLENLTGVNVLQATYLRGGFWGLKMTEPQTKEIIDLYYRCVRLGTPFLSNYPEEYVMTAIMGKVMPGWELFPYDQTFHYDNEDEARGIAEARRRGIYFFWRKH